MSIDGVKVDTCLYSGRCECCPEVEVTVLGDEHDLQLTTGVGFSDEPQGRRIGCVCFPFVGEIRSIAVHEALLDLILRDMVSRRELSPNIG